VVDFRSDWAMGVSGSEPFHSLQSFRASAILITQSCVVVAVAALSHKSIATGRGAL